MKRKYQTKNQTDKRQRINFKMQRNQLRKQLLSTIKSCLVQKKILTHRKRNGKVEYLVKWLNYPKSQATWEPEDNISDKHLIASYLLQQNSVSLDCFSLTCCSTCVLCFHLYFFSLFTSQKLFFHFFISIDRFMNFPSFSNLSNASVFWIFYYYYCCGQCLEVS